ncbi:magnesium/cobalt transporter CorA [Synechocystis sp. LKSZ1]|uniref:magnesium/cobalt transporter CorA n=1 Tax=Synechocystis sp. LKSZ1 TaxID=3144951 RepID=UPI00336BF489
MTQSLPNPEFVLRQFRTAEPEEEEEDYFDYFYDEPGSEPGTLSIEPDAHPSRIVLIDYSPDHAVRKSDLTPNALRPYLGTNTVSWMDIQGLGSEEVLKQVGEIFKLHPLLLEDVVNVPQRAKFEDYHDHIMVIAHRVRPNPEEDGFESEQVSFVLGKRYLLTFQEGEITDCFDPVRDRIRTSQGRVCHEGADYLVYLLMDMLIDEYFPLLEDYEERIEALEDTIIRSPNSHLMEEIYHIRRELLALRRLIWPLRHVMNVLLRDTTTNLITPEVRVYFRDCYDHIIQVLDIIEAYRELAASLMEVYMTSMSNKMNEVMKFLTVISTIFIPLTFIAGVYGMNFEYMPELKSRWGYWMTWGVMITIAGGSLFFFWRRGWLSPSYDIKDD